MKHLRKFNENVNVQELKEFCEEYLAYLLDEEFEIRTVNIPEISVVIIRLSHSKRGFLYSEVEDHFIPFLHMLNNNYKIGKGIKSNRGYFDPELLEILKEEPIEFDFVEDEALNLSVKQVLKNKSKWLYNSDDLSCIDIKIISEV